MNKFLIPSILTATVLIAGIFAFMPIDKASTVHTTIIASALTIKAVTATCNTDGNVNDGELEDVCDVTIDIDEGVPFQFLGYVASMTNLNAGEVYDINQLCYGPANTIMGYESDNLNDDRAVVFADEGDRRNVTAIGLGEGTIRINADTDAGDDVEDEILTFTILLKR